MATDIIKTDALIVGAGPCGLFQVFELGLLGIRAHIVDSMRVVGGQCAELYPDKPIYDIPGIPECSGQELIDNLMLQIKPFDAVFHLGEEVATVVANDGGFDVSTDAGTRFQTKTLFIAGGVGSFQPRRVRLDGIEMHEDKSLYYRVREPQKFAGKTVVIFGGGDSALDWTLALQPLVKSLTLVHRRAEYRAAPATVEAMKKLVAAGGMRELIGKISEYRADHERLTGISVTTESGVEEIDCDALLVFWGLAPKLGPIAEWGLDINRKTINVDTEKFETSTPGIYAVGDINYYPGKKKLILSGFHEAALAAFAAKERIEPGTKARLQYTTTSPLMHERLGIKD
ncbi:MAG TPA: NAD(P)/FAD-dependent oxidoreductase [Woeseiaceae bacterium]|nr:NAD(P)/FAD-dependent oxidoreductase [Woeseiaceae bacterium]